MSSIKICISILFVIVVNGQQFSDVSEFLPTECGIAKYGNVKSARIVNGQRAGLGQFPWIARLGTYLKKKKKISFSCGGSLINRFYVISAAHCTEYVDVVRLGEYYVDTDEDCVAGRCAPPHQDISIKEHYQANFCIKNASNDFMLVELEEPAQFNDYVQPFCLPSKPVPYKDLMAEDLFIPGWGLTKSKAKELSDHLLYITVPAVDKKRCPYSPIPLPESEFCIGSEKGTGHPELTCSGDSGGPVIKFMEDNGTRRAYLVGVVSRGPASCEDDLPAVHTNVWSYMDVIIAHVKKM